MNEPTKDFTPEAVLALLAQALRCNKDNLEICWDETVTPRNSFWVMGRNGMDYMVFASVAAAEAECQKNIAQSLFSGMFFVDNQVDRQAVEAVARVCKLGDLTSYLTVASREGWAMPSADEDDQAATESTVGAATKVSEIKVNQAAVLATWLKDPVAAIWKLQGGDWGSTLAVMVEQCEVDVDVLTKAIMDGMGGWCAVEGCSVIWTTVEGYVIVAVNEAAREFWASENKS